jgi:hypothetical protein
MVNGVNQATFLILPMLGKHPEEYPRFRDCFVGALENSEEEDQFGIPKKKTTDEKVISVYTRTGGANRREFDEQIQAMRAMPTYIEDYDDDFDSTFAVFVFSIPEKWEKDFATLVVENLNTISEEYKEELKRVFPKLAEKFDVLFPKK